MDSGILSFRKFAAAALLLVCLFQATPMTKAQLSPFFYARTCPGVFDVIRAVLKNAFVSDPRIGASLLRLHFHDCFVQGCEGSVLLDNSTTIVSEKFATPNVNSLRGFDVVDKMKAALELVCPKTVSCADILAIAAQESVTLSGGPFWLVSVGRRDGVTANISLADTALPSESMTLDELRTLFAAVGLNTSSDLVALSGAHTFGRARCSKVFARLKDFNGTGEPDPTLQPAFREELERLCLWDRDPDFLLDFDAASPDIFDNAFYKALQRGRGLLQSDQELFSTPGSDTINIVNDFSRNSKSFFDSFVISMIRMGDISPLTGTQGEIRLNCRVINSQASGGIASAI